MPFSRDNTLNFCKRVLCAPAEPFTIFSFSPEMWDSLRPKYLKKKKKTQIFGQKNKKQNNPFVKGSAGAPETHVQKFRVSENGVNIGL